MLQSAVRARARESRSLAGAPVADPKGPHKAPSPQPSCAQAERPGNRVAPCRRAHGSVGPLRWDGRSLCGSPGRSPARSPASAWTSGPDWLWGFGRWGRAGRDNEALGATQSGQRDPGARPQLGPGEGVPRMPGSSLKASRERPSSRLARSAGRLAGGRLRVPGSRGRGQAAAGTPRCSVRPLGRSSLVPAPRQVRVWARSSSATASCAWCGLSGW